MVSLYRPRCVTVCESIFVSWHMKVHQYKSWHNATGFFIPLAGNSIETHFSCHSCSPILPPSPPPLLLSALTKKQLISVELLIDIYTRHSNWLIYGFDFYTSTPVPQSLDTPMDTQIILETQMNWLHLFSADIYHTVFYCVCVCVFQPKRQENRCLWVVACLMTRTWYLWWRRGSVMRSRATHNTSERTQVTYHSVYNGSSL